jgi:hypothetical protein
MIATVIGTNGSIPSGSVTFSDATQGPLACPIFCTSLIVSVAQLIGC